MTDSEVQDMINEPVPRGGVSPEDRARADLQSLITAAARADLNGDA